MKMKSTVKRVLDVIQVCFLLFFLLPVYLIIFSALLLEQIVTNDYGPLIISEPRFSKGRVFKLYKLNMFKEHNRQDYINQSAYYAQKKSWAHLRKEYPTSIRWFGKIMKKTYMDELGQLFNILIGDMSFVGPRPQPIGDPRNDQPPRRLLKAGLVGFSVNDWKNDGDLVAKFKTDEEYLELYQTASPLVIIKIDLIVILDGIRAVFKAKGL